MNSETLKFLSKFGRFLKGQLLLGSVSLWFLVIIYEFDVGR